MGAVIAGLAITAVFFPPVAEAIQVTIIPAIDDQGTPVEHPERYLFYLDPFDPAETQLFFPCGAPFELPTGGFYAWVEGPGKLSQRVVFHGPGPDDSFSPHREFRYTVGPAGTVTFSSEFRSAFPEDAEIRLLGLDAHRRGGTYSNEFAKTRPIVDSDDDVQMPTGSVIVAVVDPKTSRYLHVSKPVPIREGKSAAIPFETNNTPSLVVRLERSQALVEEINDDVTLHLKNSSGALVAPDVVVPAMARVYAVWYGLEPGTAAIKLESKKYWLPEAIVSLAPDTVVSFAATLQATATLDLTLLLPDELNGQPTSVTIARNGEEISTVALEPSFPAEASIHGLPRSNISIAVIVGPWQFKAETDLTPGDGSFLLAPDAVRIHGEVTVDGDPAAASVGFLTNRSSRTEEVAAESMTDEYGEFTAVVFSEQVQPVALVSIGDREPLWWWIEAMPLRDGDRLVIEIEGRPMDLRIVDATSGEGITEATVAYGWEGTGGGGRQTNADDQGKVSLPPIPAERLKVFVRAPGYRQSQRTIDLRNNDETREVEIPLQREPEENSIAILLEDGSPAAGAEIALVPSEGALPRSIKTADNEGRFTIEPGRPDEIYAIRHRQGGTSIGRVSGITGSREISLSAGGNSLRIRVVEPGGSPVPYAQIALWMNGLRIQGGFLAWLAGGADAADRNGEWTLHNIPPHAVELLAWQLSEDQERLQALSNGEMDYRRQSFRPPWNEQQVLEAVLR